MTKRIIFTAFAIFLCLAAHPAFAQAEADNSIIGTILEIQGSATVAPEGGAGMAAAIDTPLHLNDTVQTGKDSRVFILFIDNTELTLSEDTQVKIDEYVYDPDDDRDNRALYSVMQGTFQYVSGLIGKKENPDVHIETPVGNIGIRGTDFWAGELDGEYSVAVNEGRVALKTDAGEEIVNKGEGTSVRDRRSMPARARAWHAEKLQRIAQTVHLKRRELVKQRISAMQERHKLMRQRYKEHLKTRRENRQEKMQQQRDQRQDKLQQRREEKQEKIQQLRQNLQQQRQQRQMTPQNGGATRPAMRPKQGGR